MIDPSDMILLAEVAEARSFTAAGQRLGVPKSTVSQRIARLEQQLDLKLLNRSTRQVSLTSAGTIFLEHCQRVRTEVQAGATAMGNVKYQPSGTLRITCPEVTATYFMPGLLHGFTQAFPRITVELIATNRPLDIVRERIDFAFRVGSVTDQNLITRRLSAIRRILVASPSYLATAPRLSQPRVRTH
ncbi:LysR family transcriptional regulator [Xinfangfangia sp. CPCC 101601]|uniref:LysR family transcriptional regulator n=1 Tax=Pseudogemmobacter lacusdianii TaxID=3069608 RepID=A0ABU0W2J2_9RHOB|nr:LysR family transcriptional regulator [Xinfangfangia sp. CPCC 101601]MDQ2068238.1 LysR family transcriptional regulator [Xinfangfangia sp. CPCC 101601]